MKKLYLILLLFSVKLMGQQDAYLSLIDYQMALINPAHAGSDGQQNFRLNSRNQWMSIEDSPRTLSMAYSVARAKNVGLGISIISDEIFIEKQTFISLDFSYKLNLDQDKLLYFGIKGGLNSFKANTTNLTAYSPMSDPAKKDMSRLNPNVGVGMLFKNNQHWFSMALPRLFNVNRNEEIFLNAKDRVHFYMAGGTSFKLNEEINLEPKFIHRSAQGIEAITEGVLAANYKNKFDFGLGFRTGNVVSIKMNIDMGDIFSLSYAYDSYGGSNTIINQLNAHEIGLMIRLSKQGENTAEETVATDTSN